MDCWNCGEDHYARNCPHQMDASNAQVRRGANAVSMSLVGGGDVTAEQLEDPEQLGSVDEARSWVAAVYDATECWMAAVQWNQGAEGSTQLHAAACFVPPVLAVLHTLLTACSTGIDSITVRLTG